MPIVRHHYEYFYKHFIILCSVYVVFWCFLPPGHDAAPSDIKFQVMASLFCWFVCFSQTPNRVFCIYLLGTVRVG